MTSPLPLNASTALHPKDSLAWEVKPITSGPGANFGRFLTYGRGEEGCFRLHPVGCLNEDHLVHIKFQPALPADTTLEALLRAPHQDTDEKTIEDHSFHVRQAQLGLGDNELGYLTELSLALG
jgi:hypothetical protein